MSFSRKFMMNIYFYEENKNILYTEYNIIVKKIFCIEGSRY